MNILVTGSNGFLGSNLCNLLNKNHNIYAVSRKFDKLDYDITFIYSEMSDYTNLGNSIENIKIDCMIHCAWMGGNSSLDINKLWQTENIHYSSELLKICSKLNIEHFVCLGSSAEYGYQDAKFDETTICKPDSMYGITKNSFKSISEHYCSSHNILHTWIRPVYTYGPNDVLTRLIPKTIVSLLNNQDLSLNKCSSIVDYLYVEDFAYALKEIVEKKISGDYIICADQEIRIKNVVELIYNKIKPNCSLFFDDNKEESKHSYVCGTSKKIKSLTDWLPKIDFEEGIERTIHHYKKLV
jgi:nucleoside-diphosphate-sugar epimerase